MDNSEDCADEQLTAEFLACSESIGSSASEGAMNGLDQFNSAKALAELAIKLRLSLLPVLVRSEVLTREVATQILQETRSLTSARANN